MPHDFVEQELAQLRDARLYRTLRRVDGDQGPTLLLDGRDVVNFLSNNYLGKTLMRRNGAGRLWEDSGVLLTLESSSDSQDFARAGGRRRSGSYLFGLMVLARLFIDLIEAHALEKFLLDL